MNTSRDEPLAAVIHLSSRGAAPPPPPTRAPSPSRRRGPVLAAAVAVALVVVAAAVVVVSRRGGDDLAGSTEVASFLAAWQVGDTAAMQGLVNDPAAPVAADLQAVTSGLHATSTRLEPGRIRRVPDTDRLEAPFSATVELAGLGTWHYDGTVPVVTTGDGPKVVWSRSVIHPAVGVGQVLDRTRQRGERGAILARDDRALVQPGPSVTVGAEPQRVIDEAAMAATLHDALGVDAAAVVARLHAPGVEPDHFVPLVTVAKDRYLAVKPVIHPVPGLTFREGTSRLGLADGFASQVVGHTGEITAEGLRQLGPAYQAGDQVGLDGLEAAQERVLAGTPSGDVRLLDGAGAPVRVLYHIAGTPPAPVRTTLDVGVQTAVESALDGVSQPAAFVVVDGSGAIRAAASRPSTDAFDRALLGQYPPGSTFKVVTAAALLAHGSTPASPLQCPAQLNVGGRVFGNFEGEHAGTLDLTEAMVISCNTAFIGAAQQLPEGALAEAAGQFGFGRDPTIGLAAKGGAFPAAGSTVEAAAAAIGQGKVLASPLQMAQVASTARTGTWVAPSLVVEPAPVAAPGTAGPPAGLGATVRTSLDQMLHQVVARGTGTEAAVAGRDIAGKTGTAEFGDADPPREHAWFIGWSGELAFAVVVEGGGVGGKVAAPVAATATAAFG